MARCARQPNYTGIWGSPEGGVAVEPWFPARVAFTSHIILFMYMTTIPTLPLFKQPLYYLDETEIHPITPQVDNDLEFHSREASPATNSAIDILCSPCTPFAKRQCAAIRHFTSNTNYLEQTQQLLSKINPADFHATSGIFSPHDTENPREYEAFTDPAINAKYGFLEWNAVKHLNKNSTFLQCMSYVNLTSPILAFLIPIVFFIVPFFLLKLQNVPITFQQYLETLQRIAKHHFIGKMLNVKSFSLENISYILFLSAIYGLQLYQNYYSGIHFYQNMKLLNSNLNSLKTYLRESEHNMRQFIELCDHNKISGNGYKEFAHDLKIQCEKIRQMNAMLMPITEDYISFSNIGKLQEFGHMLKCYYAIYNEGELRETIEYAFDFDGYLQNTISVHLRLVNGDIHAASFSSTDDASEADSDTESRDECEETLDHVFHTKIVDQHYVFLLHNRHVKNTVCFENGNLIITGVNASGKTTVLKTTALNILFSQIYGIGFYKQAEINPYQCMHSYLNIPDTCGRDSLFQAESRRCKEIIDMVERNPKNKRHFCIFDELYSGTNPREATKSAYSFLNYLLKKRNVDFMLTTHYTSLCHKFAKSETLVNLCQMQVDVGETGEFLYTYLLQDGICELEGGVEILKQMDYPREILDEMRDE